jgi:hypothetical protein
MFRCVHGFHTTGAAPEHAWNHPRRSHRWTMAVDKDAAESADASAQVSVSQLVLHARDGDLEAVAAAVALPAPTSVCFPRRGASVFPTPSFRTVAALVAAAAPAPGARAGAG